MSANIIHYRYYRILGISGATNPVPWIYEYEFKVAPEITIDVMGDINVTGVYKVDGVQVVSNRVIDARCDDAINSGDATTDGVIDALRDAMIAHGLIAAA